MTEQHDTNTEDSRELASVAGHANALQGGTRSWGSANPSPLLSVIVVVFQDRQELGALIDNITPFRGPDLELIVIDGGSQDGTVDLLKQQNSRVDFWLSERDRGIYDAMNKAIRAAEGTYLLHLNAGDRLLCVPWDDLWRCAEDKIDVVCCRVLLDSQTEFISRTSLLSKLDNTWHHQGTFYRRAAHLGYDISYPTGADFDHNQRLLKSGCSTRQLPAVVADHRSDGVTARDTAHQEIYRSVRANFGWRYLLLSKLRFRLMDVRRVLRQAVGQGKEGRRVI